MRADAATRRQRVLEEVAAGQTPAAAAERAGVTLRTARRYLADPDTKTQLRTIRDSRLSSLAGRALAEATPALAILREVADSEDAPPAARVSAAKGLLDVMIRLIGDADLTERVAKLEDLIDQGAKI